MGSSKKILISKELEGIIDEENLMSYPEETISNEYLSVQINFAPGSTSLTGNLSGLELGEDNSLKSIDLILTTENLNTLLSTGISSIREIVINTRVKLNFEIQQKAKKFIKLKQAVPNEPIYIATITFCR